MSEKQIPQVVGNIENGQQGMELLEWSFLRPRQARYQAALRPDMRMLLILLYFVPESEATTVHEFFKKARELSDRAQSPVV